jgi:hypothetical protein
LSIERLTAIVIGGDETSSNSPDQEGEDQTDSKEELVNSGGSDHVERLVLADGDEVGRDER